MASILAHRPASSWFGRRTGDVARRALAFALGLPAGAALVFLLWPALLGEAPHAVEGPVRGGEAAADPAPVSLARAVDRALLSTVAIESAGGDSGSLRVGTGVVVDDRGGVLSVRIDRPAGPEKIWAVDALGHRHEARWLAADRQTGLTLLEIQAPDAVPIRPSSRAATLGEDIFLIGNPYGLGHSVGRGSIAGLGRRLDLDPHPLGGLIQVQAPIHPGDSGALLADLQGGWLGLVRGGLALPGGKDGAGDHDLGFAIPAEEASWIAGRLRDLGKVDRAYLGIFLGGDRPDEPGASVKGLEPGGPAERAGLRPKDRITSLADRPIRSGDDLTDRLDRLAAGTAVTLGLIRESASLVVTVLLGSRPEAATPAAPARPEGPAPTPAPVVPREVLDQIQRLERRLDDLDKAARPAPAPAARPEG